MKFGHCKNFTYFSVGGTTYDATNYQFNKDFTDCFNFFDLFPFQFARLKI